MYDTGDDVAYDGRVSTIKIIDKTGNVIHTLSDLPHDIYIVEISSNGRFLVYGYGEPIEHAANFPKSGFRIIDLKDNSIFYEKEVYRIKGFFQNENEINITTDEQDGYILYSFGEETNHLYKMNKANIVRLLGNHRFINIASDTISVDDLTFVK